MKVRHVLAFLVVGAMALWAVAVFHVHAAASAGGAKTVAPSAEIAKLHTHSCRRGRARTRSLWTLLTTPHAARVYARCN